ncbi:unnamed protein product, partial [Scytosiphon promiscuus]
DVGKSGSGASPGYGGGTGGASHGGNPGNAAGGDDPANSSKGQENRDASKEGSGSTPGDGGGNRNAADEESSPNTIPAKRGAADAEEGRAPPSKKSRKVMLQFVTVIFLSLRGRSTAARPVPLSARLDRALGSDADRQRSMCFSGGGKILSGESRAARHVRLLVPFLGAAGLRLDLW